MPHQDSPIPDPGKSVVALTANLERPDPTQADPNAAGSLLEPGGAVRLQRWLVRGGDSFRMAIVEAKTPAERDTLIAWLTRHAAAEGKTVRPVNLHAAWETSHEDLLAYLRERIPAPARDAVLALTHVEPAVWEPEEGLLRQLNIQRGLVVQEYPCPWVFFVHPSGRLQMVHRAPDFFDFASLRVGAAEGADAEVEDGSLAATPTPRVDWNRMAGPPPAPAPDPLSTHLREAWEALERFDLPEAGDRIERAALAPGGETSPWLPVLRARLVWLHGDAPRALEYLDQLPASPPDPPVPPAAAAALLHATILFRQGETREAESRVRGLLSALDGPELILWTAEAQDLLADLLEARGDLDEALRIREAECLPVYERLQDVRSRAITWGKIADIREARGDLDEALRILQEEELPVFERLQDVRSLLVGRANQAINLFRRSAPGDREEATRLLRLALAAAEQMRLPEAEQIRGLMRQMPIAP